mgnify:FL=1
MFDSHDDGLWEVPSIDVDVPVEAAVPDEDESSTDGYDQAVAEAPEDDGYDMDGLDGKLLEHFAGKIVRKDLTAL